MSKHTLLFLAATSHGTDRRALDQEAREIRVELERSRHRDRFELVWRAGSEPMDLLRELRRLRPTVVHFSGHGGPGDARRAQEPRRDIECGGCGPDVIDDEAHAGLVFQGPDGQPQRVPAAALEDTFGAAGTSVRLVVLHACYTDTQAAALLAHVDCVVGTRGSIGDAAARRFAIGFYGGLGDGESVAAAFQQGCAAIHLEAPSDSDRPRLRVRAGVDASQLVLAAGPGASPTAARGAGDIDASRPASAAGSDMDGCTPAAGATRAAERLARVKQRIEDTVTAHPGLRALLAQKLGCKDAEVVDQLVRQTGTEVAKLVRRLELDELSAASGAADRAALRTVFFAVLPYVSDLREAVAACSVRPQGDRDVVELRYRTATIAEAVVAGSVERPCAFELVGNEPRGVGAVPVPASARTALFASSTHLRAAVVDVLAGRLGTTGTSLAEKTKDVESGLAEEAEMGLLYNDSRAHPVRYYFVFRDIDHKDAEATWKMVVDGLHGPDGLPSLVLVRLNGAHRPKETDLQRNLVHLLRPRS